MPTARLSSPITAPDILKRIRKEIDTLTPELLLARLAARGGKAVLERLAEVEQRLTSQRAYWRPVSRKTPA